MTDWQRYLQPEKVEEALAALDTAGGRARQVAGGIDLLRPFSDRLARYRMPGISHSPEIVSIVVEHPKSKGPHGAKGVGEVVSIPTTSAITNAIAFAAGVRIRSLPVDQDWLALEIHRRRSLAEAI